MISSYCRNDNSSLLFKDNFGFDILREKTRELYDIILSKSV
jgi:hypothetical protein